jgi:hypothetical protein
MKSELARMGLLQSQERKLGVTGRQLSSSLENPILPSLLAPSPQLDLVCPCHEEC